MTITYSHKPLSAKARFDVLITFTLEAGATITSTQATLVDRLPAKSQNSTSITGAMAGTNISGTQYEFLFGPTETEKLLLDSSNASSGLKYDEVFLSVKATGTDASARFKEWCFYSNGIVTSSCI